MTGSTMVIKSHHGRNEKPMGSARMSYTRTIPTTGHPGKDRLRRWWDQCGNREGSRGPRRGLMTTAQTGLELEDFLPQPPKQLGSQASATRPSSMVCFFKGIT